MRQFRNSPRAAAVAVVIGIMVVIVGIALQPIRAGLQLVEPVNTATPTPTSGCLVSAGVWVNSSFTQQTGLFTVTFDATPNHSPVNAVMGLSNVPAATYTDLATSARFNPTGNIDSLNGGTYQATNIVPYGATLTYHFRMVVDIPNHLYSTYVTPPGGAETLVGANYAFRTQQAGVTSLNNLAVNTNLVADTDTVCNFTITSGVQTPTATGVPTAVPTATATSTATGVPPSNTPSPAATGTPTGVPTVLPTVTPTQVVIAGAHYVSKLGNNSSGSSWANAWTELANINWAVIVPGDTILVDGGASSMTYTSALVVASSGTASSPITIRLAPDAGRNGQVIIFGGRTILLPYCEQVTYVKQTGNRLTGIDLGGRSYVVVDGTKWNGILVNGFDDHGISVNGSNNTVKYLEITDNGTADFITGSNFWRPNQPGIRPGGSNLITLDHLNVHDNGQDAMQSGQALTNITISYSWFHNARTHPLYTAAVASNYCKHSDGFQIYGGGLSSGVTFDHTILGPGFLQGTLLGQTSSATANVDNVTFSNVLVLDGKATALAGYNDPATSRNWLFDHVTIYQNRSPNWKTGNPGDTVGNGYNNVIYLAQSSTGINIRNSIFWDGRWAGNSLPSGVVSSNNCFFTPYPSFINPPYLSGTLTNPQFASPPPLTVPDATGGLNRSTPSRPTLAEMEAADYTPSGTCAGRGSAITSVSQLLAQ